MDESSIAHALPKLYLSVLGDIASLELAGHRSEADLIRRAAIRTYSGSWDPGALVALEHLRLRAARVLGGHERPRHPRTVHPALRLLRLRRVVA